MDSRDIAKLAGVSRSTVSRVINNHPNVSAETRAKVLKIIKDLDYVPDSSARALVGKKKKVIGLFIIDSNNSNNSGIFSSNYYSPFTAAVIDQANKLNYHVLVSLINSDSDFTDAKKLLKNKSISGAIFVGAEDDSQIYLDFINDNFSIAIVDQSVPNGLNSKNAVYINSDNITGSYLATEHLIKTNHKKIAHVTGNLLKLSGKERLRGYTKALENYNITVNEDLIVSGDFSEESGYRAVCDLFKRHKPDAIFLANDSMALGALRAIKEQNINLISDVSIIGYDNIDISQYLGLSTVRASIHDMASVTVLKLIRIIEGNASDNINNIIDCQLLIRNSSR